MVISYQQYEYNDNLSKKLPVINDTTNLSKRLPVINDTTDLSEGLPIINDATDLSERLPVINNMTDLSEELPVIDDTSANMTCVVVLSINALMTCVFDKLYSCLFNQHLMTYMVAELCGLWPL